MPAAPHRISFEPCAPLRIARAAAIVALLVAAAPARGASHAPGYPFVSPLPDSRLVSRWSEITIRSPGRVNGATIDASRLAVTGSRSGGHGGSLVLSDDGRTLVFKPDRPFEPGEVVRVTLAPGIRDERGADLPPLDLRFTVSPSDPARPAGGPLASLAEELPPELASAWASRAARTPAALAAGMPLAGPGRSSPAAIEDTMPAGYPSISLITANDPDTGVVFLAPFGFTNGGNLAIVDNRAQPIYYRRWPTPTFDFKRQPNGLLTFFSFLGVFYAMDSTYAVVDSFRCGNGYVADEHELQLLPNGHALLLAYDQEPYPMDTVVAGGNPHAQVIGLIVQELDQAKNVVFQWRSWDHFQVTDLTTCVASLTDSIVDAVHGNALELDQDGNILLSSRHLSEITKIDRSTGDIIWRLGLNAKNNQFTFLNDPTGFANQHDIRRQPDGHITLFDNANCIRSYSRVAEYELDEVNKTARLVWEFRNTPDTFTPFMGNQQRHPDGTITISWGGTSTNPKMSELHADGSKAFELGLGPPFVWTYRAFRFPWQTTAFVTDRDSLDFGTVTALGSGVRWLRLTNHLSAPLTINSVSCTASSFSVVSAMPITLASGGTDSLGLLFVPTAVGPARGDLYVRAVTNTQIIARVLGLSGTASSFATAITVNDVARPEGTGALTPFPFTVRLSAAASETVTVDYATADSTAAVSDEDYVPISGTAIFPPGVTTATITAEVRGDSVPESNQCFKLRLANPTHAVIARAVGVAEILDDDEAVAAVGGGAALPARFALHPPGPNPASRAATIGFDLPRAAEVAIEVFDVRGRRIATIARGVLPAGRSSATWTTSGRAAGVYFVRMRAGEFRATQKLVLVR